MSPAFSYPPISSTDHVYSWFLDNPDLDWAPPESLLAFLKQARADGTPLVDIGFGSITVPDPQGMTEHVYQAVQKSKHVSC